MRFEIYDNAGVPLTIPIPECYRDCVDLIRSDYYRLTGQTTSVIKMWAYSLRYPAFAILFWLRLASIHGVLFWPAKIVHRHYSSKYGFQIYPSMKVGYGFCLGHGIDIVINPQTVIGNNVNVYQFVNIGTTRDHAAVIGDNVTVFPMSCIVNDVHLGNQVTIGAGSVVVKDVPVDATVAGVPAKVLNYKRPGHFVGNRWPLNFSK